MNLFLLLAPLSLFLLYIAWKERTENKRLRTQCRVQEEELLTLRIKTQSDGERLSFLAATQEKLTDTFRALSWEALEKNSRFLLDNVKEVALRLQKEANEERARGTLEITTRVAPVQEALKQLEESVKQFGNAHGTQQAELRGQLTALLESDKALRHETGKLSRALRAPSARGKWGEIQLRRTVEIAGMLPHCDFFEQVRHEGEERRWQPDLLVRLPGERQILVDAKVPLQAFLEALDLEGEDERLLKFKEHAAALRRQIIELGKKSYWDHFQPTPEFIVLFLPSEAIFGTALDHDPMLLEIAAEKGVILATPMTLIALLRTVAFSWKQHKLSHSAEEIQKLGRELYGRISDVMKEMSKLGKALEHTIEGYNRLRNSIDQKLTRTAARFEQLGAGTRDDTIEPAALLQRTLQPLQPSDEK